MWGLTRTHEQCGWCPHTARWWHRSASSAGHSVCGEMCANTARLLRLLTAHCSQESERIASTCSLGVASYWCCLLDYAALVDYLLAVTGKGYSLTNSMPPAHTHSRQLLLSHSGFYKPSSIFCGFLYWNFNHIQWLSRIETHFFMTPPTLWKRCMR